MKKQYYIGFIINYDISCRSDFGIYKYNDAGPHAVTGLTNTAGTLLPSFDQTVDYTAFNKASHISQGDYDYFITYGPDRQRGKTLLDQSPGGNTILTKYYAFGDYEKEITEDGTRHLHYIAGEEGLEAIYVKYDNAPDEMYFILKDHLGSITGAINSETGIVYRQNFDAWGRKRNPVDWSYSNIPDFPFDRGYTGHEHLKWFGLINMNGRLYDAAICRFLSPDPYVQMPDYSQSFNRYSYCLNNPLVFTDPTGEKWWHWALVDILTGGMASLTTVSTYSSIASTLPAIQGTASALDYTSIWFRSFDDPEEAAKKLENAVKIDAGLFLHIPGWETEQTLTGNGIAHFRNLTGNVDNVEIENWTMLVNDDDPDNPKDIWGMTWGPYVNSKNVEVGDDIYYHELGHTIQSRIIGPLYTTKVAIPSGISAYYSYYLKEDGGEYHNNAWYEVWASRLGGAPNHEKKYRKQSFWYWCWITVLPIYPN